jgi:tRNA A-37 threonylcarbamoyl transferase component Bud32
VGNGVARTVGRYEILEELGRGGMATVYLARQADLERLVALKELSAFRQSDRAFTRRFLRESQLAGSLSHPNIVTVHEYFEADGVPYIAMEYVARGSLRPHVGHMPLTQVAGVLEGILSALDYAEQHHIVHRDLKPENVMVTSEGRVKLTDFGIAKATGQAYNGSFLTAAGTTVGTPNYMAPEQAMGQEVGPWTDLYSVGVMAFEMFVGQVPFHDTEEPMAVLMRQVKDPIPLAHSVNADVDEAISDWIARLLVKEPEDRVQSASEAWDQLEEIVLELVGPRWRRQARLPALSPTPDDQSERAAAPRATTATGKRTARMTRPTAPRQLATSEAPTHRVRDRDAAALAPTVMPKRPTPALDDEGEAPPRPRARRRNALIKAAFVLIAALVALTAAFGNRGSDPGESSGSAPRTAGAPVVAVPTASVTGRQVALKVPRGWSRLRSVPDLGLPLSGAIALAPRGGSANRVVEFGVMKNGTASNSALLPAAFLGSIGQQAGTIPARTAVRLPAQRLAAWRYANLRPGGTGRQLTVYAVPTTDGVATVACAASSGQADAFAGQCGAIAGTLELVSGRPYPVGPSATYASVLNTAFGTLQQATTSQEATLAAAQTVSGQASAARALAGDYQAAAAQLAVLDLSPADRDVNRRLVRALQRLGKAYQTAARAATAGDATRYRAASAAIPGAKARVNSALAGLRAAGYQPATQGNRPPSSADKGAGTSAPPSDDQPAAKPPAAPESDVGDSKSDDPSDDEGDDSGEP